MKQIFVYISAFIPGSRDESHFVRDEVSVDLDRAETTQNNFSQ